MSMNVGDHIGEWTIVATVKINKGGRLRKFYEVDCSCGQRRTIRADAIESENSLSCGHYSNGRTKEFYSEYKTWLLMHQHCENKNNPRYQDWGGRGIKVCARWSGRGGFANFLADMGPRPPGLQIDRRNNDLGYDPSNCWWRNRAEQMQNRRPVKASALMAVLWRYMYRRGRHQMKEIAKAFDVKTHVVVDVLCNRTWLNALDVLSDDERVAAA